MSRSSNRLAAVGVAVLTGLTPACSLIGLGMGAAHDAQAHRRIPGWEVTKLRPGTEVVLQMADGKTLEGRYQGVVPTSDSGRALRLQVLDEALVGSERVPMPGPGATIEDRNGHTSGATLVDYESDGIRVRLPQRGDSSLISYEALAWVADAQGRRMTGSRLRDLLRAGVIVPLKDVVVESSDGDIRQVPADRIVQVRLDGESHGKRTGFIVGAVLDAVMIVAALSYDPDYAISYPEGSSCPFVYSHDGSRYVLDSEVFGGAIFEAAQRTAVDRLEHLRESEGRYRLRVTNELRETQYLDALALRVVDHPHGTLVVSDRSGDVYALGETRAPQRAHDLAGRDVTALVAARDERYWLGGPTLRDASGSSQVRDGIVVEFPRPPSADAARLVVSVRNTPWASYLLRHTLELMGPELDTWYARMNTSPAERQRFARAWLREGMLRVEIEEASGWRPGGTVWDVGPELSKWQVVPLRLPAGNPGVLRLRLSSTVAHWMIDAIAVDYGSGASVRTTRVAATSAIDGRGNDLREVLRAEDRRRHPMPSIGDRVDLVFDAPAWPDGHDRTVMLESTGYYTIHADSTGAPRVELFERLIDEPGAYGSYTVALLNDYLDRSVGVFGAD